MSVICTKCGQYRAPADITWNGICRQCKGKKSYAILNSEKKTVKKKDDDKKGDRK